MDIVYRLGGLEFEWDDTKATANAAEHGIAFEEAAEVFLDPFYQIGDASVDGEDRELLIGYSLSQHILVVVFVERTTRIRIISARRASRQEAKEYEDAPV